MSSDVKRVSDKENESKDAPPDRFHIIYFLFFFLGVVHLLPWTFFTTATEYWMYKFRNTSIEEGNSEFRTSLQANFNAAIVTSLQVSEVAFLIIGLLFGRLISVRIRFVGILSIIFLLFVLLTAFVEIDTDSWQEGFFAVVVVATFGINSMNAVFTITLYTAFSRFPRRYLAAYLLGSSLARVFTSALQIVSLATGLSVEDSALVYFGVGLLVIFTTLVFLVVATGPNQFYQYHMKNFEEKGPRVSLSEGLRLSKKIWSSAAMMGIFLISTNMSPVALVVSENEGQDVWSDIYFIPTISFLVSAISEMIGRFLGIRYSLNLGPKGWALAALIRTLLVVPLTMLSNAQPRHHLPVLLTHDYEYILLTIIANITGGYLVSRYSLNVTDMVNKEELKDAYHVLMLLTGIEMGILCVLSIVSVNLL